MQFLTIREPHAGEFRVHVNRGGRGGFWFDRFNYAIDHDPTSETIRCCWSSDSTKSCVTFLRPDIEIGVSQGCADALEGGVRICGVSFTVPFALYHDVETTPQAIQFRVSQCVARYVLPLLTPIAPLRADWLTSDVVALARGIHADAAFDRLPILSDALQDAGCADELVLNHLALCPDHGPSCWVVEMILDQVRAAAGSE